MFIKVIRYIEGQGVKSNNSENIVVPTSTLMIECECAEYSKHRVSEFREFENYMILNEIYDYKIIGEWSWDTDNFIHKNLNPNDDSCEFILIYYSKGDKFEYLVAPNCDMYLMGDDGKTIDSLRCKI